MRLPEYLGADLLETFRLVLTNKYEKEMYDSVQCTQDLCELRGPLNWFVYAVPGRGQAKHNETKDQGAEPYSESFVISCCLCSSRLPKENLLTKDPYQSHKFKTSQWDPSI